jgi:GMC oxidoreductase
MIIPETFAEGERRVTAIGEGRPGVIHLGSNTTGNPAAGLEAAEFDARVEANQRRLAAEIRPSYDFIVCESGSSGSVVAGRLAESGHASVLLLDRGRGHRRRANRKRSTTIARQSSIGTGLGISGCAKSVAQCAQCHPVRRRGGGKRLLGDRRQCPDHRRRPGPGTRKGRVTARLRVAQCCARAIDGGPGHFF